MTVEEWLDKDNRNIIIEMYYTLDMLLICKENLE